MARNPFGRPLDLAAGRIELAHGAGGRAQAQLVVELFARHLANPCLARHDDGAVLPALASGERLVVSTDSHVVTPLIFPGGDIGQLAVNGTINDVAMMGAKPVAVTVGFILEEGLELSLLDRLVASLAAASQAAGVPVVAGDTKVVERGKADGLYITTTGLGVIPAGRPEVGGAFAKPGDAVLLSGTIGDHGMAIMSRREALEFSAPIASDCAALHTLVEALFASGADIHVLRDPTRGGLATTLNEIAQQSGVGIAIEEAAIPIRPAVAAACEFLGLDPLYVANEGKLVAFCASNDAERALAALRAHPLGREAAIIGRAIEDEHRFVRMHTRLGGTRIVDWLTGEMLPRIC